MPAGDEVQRQSRRDNQRHDRSDHERDARQGEQRRPWGPGALGLGGEIARCLVARKSSKARMNRRLRPRGTAGHKAVCVALRHCTGTAAGHSFRRRHARPVENLVSRPALKAPCRCRYRSGFITTSSVGHGGPARRAVSSARPALAPFGNWSPVSQRHAATIAKARRRHSWISPESAPE
jgi:hypothetical protein